ncbi:MAG TPA: phosphogluconate dehydrogenase C-terminal domain-containing protein [Alphaproteobacteria bacterium]|nr:phosphogluconate dehydrogenase C-terminal domain-containing protein [Alphaproteobacteria bacterium]
MTAITIMGAGGKMGYRVSKNLGGRGYDLRHVEVSEAGRKRLEEIGVNCLRQDSALDRTDVVILAVPDSAIRKVSHTISPLVPPGAMMIALDAAAPFAGDLPDRPDLAYFVAHPCHPPILNDEVDPEAQHDHFGGVAAKQHIVCSLMQGPESAYALGEEIARHMFAPVMRSHRVSVEQMALLEPVLSETVGATCITIIREAMDEAIRRGVPAQAAQDFIEGHLRVEIAILFGHLPGAQFSDAAKRAVERAKSSLFRPDWKKVFEPAAVAESIQLITR